MEVLVIDSVIGNWGFSKTVVRNFLADAGKNPVEIIISSPGGDVDHALDIYNQFAAHGDVYAKLSGLVASSATIIALAAKKTVMFSNSFYLIHQPSKWVDEWGQMNSDEIDQLIANLEKAKDTLEKVTLSLVKMYVDKTGKTSKEILDLMKESKWLNAQEAKDWGFVDEIIEPIEVKNWLEDDRMVALIVGNGLPSPVRASAVVEHKPADLVKNKETFMSWLKEFFNPQNHKASEMKKFTRINNLLSVTALESTDDQGVYLNESQLQAIEDQLATAERSNLDRQQAENSLQNAMTSLDEIDATVADAKDVAGKVTAIKAKLAGKPGAPPSTPKGNDGEIKDGVDWDMINTLPHNREFDEMN